MNIVFLSGIVINEPLLKFTYENRHIDSISYFNLLLQNNTQITIYGTNNIADLIFSKLKKGNKIFLFGKIRYFKKQIFIELEYFQKA